jgi:hypothetical protein
MQLRWLFITAMVFVVQTTADAAAMVQLELATERGLQITAPQEWLQRLARAGIENVRIRGASPGDTPSLTNQGSEDRPVYHLVGILTAREELLVPGATFGRNDLAKLREYMDRLAAEGIEGVTAARGQFDLTETQLLAVQEDFSRPIPFSTKGAKLAEVVRRVDELLARRLEGLPQSASETVCTQEIQGLTAGAGLAILLRNEGLGLQPTKPRGEPIAYRIVALKEDDDVWPVGWDPEKSPRSLVPALFEFINVEIDGYSVKEALDAIQPRIKIPFFVDRWALAENRIDLDEVKVAIPRTRTFYKRILDRALSQARLHGQLRVDEAGTPFFWITK